MLLGTALGLGLLAAAVAAWTALTGPVSAKDGSLVGTGTPSTVAGENSRYRYTVLSPARPPRVTVVARIEREGGRVDRWWYLRGAWAIPAGSYRRGGAGLSADEGTLVLTALDYGTLGGAPTVTRLAVLDTQVHLRHPQRTGESRPAHAVRRIALRGRFEVDAVSPDGSSAYLAQYGPPPRPGRGPVNPHFRIRRLDLATGRLQPGRLRNRGGGRVALAGTPIARAADADGRWSYALYIDDRNATFLLAIDTAAGTLARVDLPRAPFGREPFGARLRIADDGGSLTIAGTDTSRRPKPLTVQLPIAAHDEPRPPDPNFLAFTQTPRRPGNLVSRTGIAAHRASGQPVWVRQLGDPERAGELVVFECLDGEPCDAGHLQPNAFGCPDPYADIYVVPSRVSESERGFAGRIVQKLTPAVTVWLHQGDSPTGVWAWGDSVPVARRFARRAGLRFRRAPILAGSAEEWLARDMPETVRISIDLPAGPLATRLKTRLNGALARLGREVSEDGDPPRKG